MKDNKLKGKDLINIGIYAAIYCLLMTCVAMLGYIPIMLPMLAVIGPIVLGVPMMCSNGKKRLSGLNKNSFDFDRIDNLTIVEDR